MNRILLTCFLIFSIIISYSQKTKIDSLGKYTYYLYGPAEVQIINHDTLQRFIEASCFFIKKHKDIFLVTAAHVITGQKHTNQSKDFNFPDTFYIRLYNKKSNIHHDFKFDISQIKKSADTTFFYNNADVYAYKIKLPKYYKVNSIEKFISKRDIDYKTLNKAVMFGFIGEVLDKCVLEEKDITRVNIIENKNVWHLQLGFKSGNKGHGDSGCPLFFELPNYNIVLGGICIGGLLNKNDMLFVESTYIMESIKKASLLPATRLYH